MDWADGVGWFLWERNEALRYLLPGLARLGPTDWAAWVQAVGSIGAIVYAVRIANRQHRSSVKLAEEARAAARLLARDQADIERTIRSDDDLRRRLQINEEQIGRTKWIAALAYAEVLELRRLGRELEFEHSYDPDQDLLHALPLDSPLIKPHKVFRDIAAAAPDLGNASEIIQKMLVHQARFRDYMAWRRAERSYFPNNSEFHSQYDRQIWQNLELMAFFAGSAADRLAEQIGVVED